MNDNEILFTDEQEDIIDHMTSEISKDVVEYFLFKIDRRVNDFGENKAVLLMIIFDSLCKVMHKSILQCAQIAPKQKNEIFESIMEQVKVYLSEDK